MVNKNKIGIVFLILLVITSFSAIAGEVHQTLYGSIEEQFNSESCFNECNFTLRFTPAVSIALNSNLTFNNDKIDYANIKINGQTIFTLEKYYEAVNRQYMATICDEYGEYDCIVFHEDSRNTTYYIKKFNITNSSFTFNAGNTYTVTGYGRKSPLTDIKWNLRLGLWELDPHWNSSWSGNASIILNATSVYNLTSDNLTANVKWNDYNSSFSYINNWLVNNLPITTLNMPFEATGNESGMANDYSNGNNGTVNGATWKPEWGYNKKGAYYFDENDYISFNSNIPFRVMNKTISFWINASEFESTKYIFNLGNGNWYVGTYTNGRILTSYRNGSGTQITTASTTNSLTANRFYHVAASWNVQGNTVNHIIYIDGVVNVNQTRTDGHSTSYSDSYFKLIGDLFNGTIDELIIFNRTLSSQQVKLIYNNKTDILGGDETNSLENWTVKVTPNDGYVDGITKISNNLKISATGIRKVILNMTNPDTNYTKENLTANVQVDGQAKIIYDWLLNSKSIAILNMPFEKVDAASNAKDYSSGNTFTVNGSTWQENGGYDRKVAYYFDEDDSIIMNTTNFKVLNKTIVFWMNATEFDATKSIFDIGNGHWYVGITNNGKIITSYRNFSGSQITTSSTFGALTAYKYHHIAVSWSVAGENVTLLVYIDGNINANQTRTDGYYNNYATSWNSAIGYLFNGTIDDLMFFNRTLSQEQIKLLYNRTDIIIGNETKAGESWNVRAIPNDGNDDGPAVTSDILRIKGVNLYNLSSIFSSSYTYNVFRFFVESIIPYQNSFNLTFDTGQNNITNSINFNLTNQEKIFVFIENNYSSSGTYNVIANSSTIIDSDSERRSYVAN